MEEKKENKGLILTILCVVGIIVALLLTTLFWSDGANEMYKTARYDGFSPATFVLFSSIFLFCACFFFINLSFKLKNTRILVLSFFFATIGVSNVCFWLVKDGRYINKHVGGDAKKDYIFIGKIEGQSKKDKEKELFLYAKVVGKKVFYYCSDNMYEPKFNLVHKIDKNIGEVKNGKEIIRFRMDFDMSSIFDVINEEE